MSACKWVVDLEVTRFDDISAYWTERGWAEQGPVKMSSRIDVPRSRRRGRRRAVTRSAASPGRSTPASRRSRSPSTAAPGSRPSSAAPPTDDTWVQWTATVDVERGRPPLRVRATDKDGLVQTGVEADVLPDGATGWHEVHFNAV